MPVLYNYPGGIVVDFLASSADAQEKMVNTGYVVGCTNDVIE